MRVERIERTDKRVVRIDRPVLFVQEQRQPIRLVAVEAMVSAQAQVKTEYDDVDQPSRYVPACVSLWQSNAAHRWAPSRRTSTTSEA